MTTESLIARLAAEAGPPGPPPGRRAALAALAGLVPSLAIYAVVLGPRPGLAALLATAPRVDFKLAAVLLLVAAAALLLPPRLSPTGAIGARRFAPRVGVAPAVVVGFVAVVVLGIAAELVALPPSLWRAAWLGASPAFCLTMVPVLAAGPFVALMAAARAAAPTRLAAAGAAVGLVAGSLGAALYATHCPDDSPLFLATWYGLAVLALAGLGALLGPRLLRW